MMNDRRGTRKQFVGKITCELECDGNLHIHFDFFQLLTTRQNS